MDFKAKWFKMTHDKITINDSFVVHKAEIKTILDTRHFSPGLWDPPAQLAPARN